MKEDRSSHKDLEQRLREAAENFQMQPSEDVWTNIKTSIPSQTKKRYLWRQVAAAAAILLLAGLSWYFINTSRPLQDNEHRPVVFSGSSSQKTETETEKKAPDHKDNDQTPEFIAAKKTEKEAIQPQYPKHQLQPEIKRVKGAGKSENEMTGLSLLKGAMDFQEISSLIPGTARLHYSEAIIQHLLHPKDEIMARQAAKEKDKKKITFGLFYSSGMSYRSLKEGPTPGPPPSYNAPATSMGLLGVADESLMMRVTRKEKPMQQKQNWGWGTGLRVGLSLGKNWLLQTGLNLQQIAYDVIAYKQDPAYVSEDGSSSIVPTSKANSTFARYAGGLSGVTKATTLENQYLNTELPLLIGKRFGDPDKLSFILMAGAGLTYLLHADAFIYAPQSQRYFSDDKYLNRLNSKLILEANMNIPLGRHLGFSVGPAFEYQLFSTYKDYHSMKEYPYLIGLKTAIRLKK